MTRKRLGTGDIRDLERAQVKPLNDNSVYLPNPTANPAVDRHKPIPSDQKARAFGLEPTSPKRLFDLPRGDAGAGQSVYRRIHAFYSMGVDSQAARTNFTKALAIITNRSSTKSPRYFHVSIYGFGIRRGAQFAGPQSGPLTIAEAQDRQFEQIYLNDAVQTPLTPRFIPSVFSAQARVMVHDESGQRFFDVDVIGNRSLSVYAWGVSVFLLVKPDGYEVDAENPDSNEILDSGFLGFEDDVVGARVVPVFTNRKENLQNRTISITIDTANPPGPIERIIPIPPGARRVQIFSNEPDPGAVPWLVQFWYGRAAGGTRPDLGIIDWEPGQSRTPIVDIVNSSAIAIQPRGPAPATGFTLVFEVES